MFALHFVKGYCVFFTLFDIISCMQPPITPSTERPGLATIRLTTDVVLLTIIDSQLRVMLIPRTAEPFTGSLVLPGGFVWDGETFRRSAERLLSAKAGISGMFLEQLATFDALDRDPRGRVTSVAYLALAAPSQLQPAAEVEFVPVSELPALGFDHTEIIAVAVERLRSKLTYTNAAYSLLPEVFVFSDLQTVYEVAFGAAVDKRNFRKKYLSLGFVEPTGDLVRGGRHRPAQLFRFKQRVPQALDSPWMG